jgi:acetyltransferase-like isoleucine patch superfamily enzyme
MERLMNAFAGMRTFTANQAYSLAFASIGDDVVIWPSAKIVNPEAITIGNSVMIDDFVFIVGGERIEIGDFVHVASFSSFTGGGRLALENFTGISSGVRIFTGNEDYSGECMTNPTVPSPYRKPVRGQVQVKKHAVIGANAVILPGVTIGEGCVISPNSVVVSDCLQWTVYVGNPARPVKARSNERILKLERELQSTAYSIDGKYMEKSLWQEEAL